MVAGLESFVGLSHRSSLDSHLVVRRVRQPRFAAERDTAQNLLAEGAASFVRLPSGLAEQFVRRIALAASRGAVLAGWCGGHRIAVALEGACLGRRARVACHVGVRAGRRFRNLRRNTHRHVFPLGRIDVVWDPGYNRSTPEVGGVHAILCEEARDALHTDVRNHHFLSQTEVAELGHAVPRRDGDGGGIISEREVEDVAESVLCSD